MLEILEDRTIGGLNTKIADFIADVGNNVDTVNSCSVVMTNAGYVAYLVYTEGA